MQIESIEQAKASNGAIFHKLKLDGKSYNYFGEFKGFVVGDEIEAEFEQKGQYTNLKSIKKADGLTQQKISIPTQVQGTLGRHDIVISRTEKPHSYEFGKATARHKIYYSDIEELKQHLDALKEAKLMENDIEPISE